MKSQIVKLSAYQPQWAQDYAYEKKRIEEVIGAYIVCIEHIGSTSVRGLMAKPIIDILVGVEHLAQVDMLVAPLSTIGYEYVPKPDNDKKFFRKGPWGQGKCHLHICEINSMEWHEKLLFRNYLRQHSDVAAAYVALKQQLAVTYHFDRPTYTKKKNRLYAMLSIWHIFCRRGFSTRSFSD